jgi:phosphatidylserine decarboxylase
MKFATEAWPFVLPPFVLAVVLLTLGYPLGAGAAALLGLLVLLFFRDPPRLPEGPEEVVLAPADGTVLEVSTGEEPEVGEGRYHRVVTFLSVFSVHVQKTPTAGEVLYSQLTSGKKLAAFKKGLEEINERHLTVIRRPGGDLVGVRQVVGLVARRIVCYLRPGQTVSRAQSLGLIKFGSRVDLMVPASYEVLVKKGDSMRNGETVVARPPELGSPREQGSP